MTIINNDHSYGDYAPILQVEKALGVYPGTASNDREREPLQYQTGKLEQLPKLFVSVLGGEGGRTGEIPHFVSVFFVVASLGVIQLAELAVNPTGFLFYVCMCIFEIATRP